MKYLKFAVLSALLAAFFGACNVYNYVSVVRPAKQDFENLKSFSWLTDETDTANSPYNNAVIRNNVRNYVTKALMGRGLVSNPDSPQVLLQLVILNKPKSAEVMVPYPENYYQSPYYYGSEYYNPHPVQYYNRPKIIVCYPMGYCKASVDYVEGSVELQMIDRKTSQLLWAATAKGDIYDPAVISQSIHPAVRAIMKKFPVKKAVSHG